MREMIARVHPVGIHGAEVLDLQLEKRPGQLSLHTETLGEGIGLELECAGDHVEEELDNGIHGRQSVGEEKEADDDWVLVVEAE